MDMGQGVYMMVGSTLGFMTSTNEVVGEVERRASSFCASSGGKTLEVVSLDTIAPELVSFPEGRLQFRCVKPTQEVASASTGSR
jgi:nitrous oxide reductase accessory protein NosL